jgi:aspartate racemase
VTTAPHIGIIGGLGVGATVLYYQGITAASARLGHVPRLTITHANAPTALAHVTAGRIDALADYLAGFAHTLAAAGATHLVIPAITPHICRTQLKQRVQVPFIDLLDITAAEVAKRGLSRVALFGTRFTIEQKLFGALSAFDLVTPQPAEIDDIHRIYLELATTGTTSTANQAHLRAIARALCSRDGVEAIILAGTDLNLIFDEANAGFPALDCLKVHVDAIVAESTGGPANL